MKPRFSVLLIGAAMIFGALPRTDAAVSFSAGVQISAPADFYAPLQPYGAWINVSTYGRCWHPNGVDVEWRPYAVGYWEWTDAGYYWVSDEPWAWACYHYGTWYYDANYGWVWIPGTEWAPAWVSWRYGGDYIGWAPYGPDFVVLGPSFFCFVDVDHFRNHFTPQTLIINNPTIINQTKVVNRFSRETREINGTRQTVVVNKGPGVDPIQRATGTKITPKPLTQVIQQTPVPETLRQRSTRSKEMQPAATQPSQTQPAETRSQQPLERTGREQPRNYQQQEKTVPEQTKPQPEKPRTVVPSEQPKPAPEKPREVLPPTGNEQPRYREVPAPEPTPQPKSEQPAERIVPPSAPERPLPPTGREVTPVRPPQRPEVVPPPRPVVPARPEVPPGQERDKDRPF